MGLLALKGGGGGGRIGRLRDGYKLEGGIALDINLLYV